MVFKAADRVQEISATVGTGPFTVTGAPSGFQTWLQGLGNGNSAYYAAYDTVNWEIGETVLTGGTTLSRNVLVSSNANALVNFPAGAKKVFLDYPAIRAVFVTPTGKLNVDMGTLTGTMAQYNASLSDGDFVFQNGDANLGQIFTGAGVSTGDARIELGYLRTGDGNSYVDFHSTVGTDEDARIMRGVGANGGFDISNTGLGGLSLTQAGAAPIIFSTTAAERMRIGAGGRVGIGTTAPAAPLHVTGPDNVLQFGVSGATKGLRVIAGPGGTVIDGVDNTLVTSYQPLILNGSQVSINGGGAERIRVDAGGILSWGGITNYSGYIGLDAASGVTKGHWYKTSGVDRWVAGASASPETGGNVGSDYFINRYADDGTYLGSPFGITRSNSLVTTTSLQVNGSFWTSGEIRTNQAGVGNVSITPGAPDHSGYVSFWHPNSARAGYIGFISTPSGGDLNYQNENGGRHNFGQSMHVGGQDIWINGINTGLLLQKVSGADSFIRSYSGNLYLGFNNNNSVLINGSGLTLNTGSGAFTGDANQLLLHPGSNNAPTLIQRNDGANFYFLLSAATTGPSGGFNTLRPFTLDVNSGYITIGHGLTVNGNATYSGSITGNNGIYTNYLQSSGEIRSVNGIFNCTGAGLSAGYRMVNNNIGHDYRLIAKDAGHLAVTNESIGVEYMAFNTAGDIHLSRQTFLDAQTYCTDIIASGWHRNTGITGLYNNTYSRGWVVPDGNGSSYGNMSVYGTGMNGWSGICLRTDNRTHLMTDGNTIALYDASVPRWISTWDYAGNFTASGNVAAYSDLRLKENVREIDNLIQRRDTLALAAIKYERDGRTRIGYGAQTLRDNGCGEFVQEADDAMKIATGIGTLSVSYGETTAVLAAASKLTDDRVAQLEAEVAELKALVATLVGR